MSFWGKQLNRIAALATLVAMTVGISTAQAATVTTAHDFLSTLQAGQLANHAIDFTTPTGAAEGTTMTLTFSAPFNTSAISEDDVDVTDNGTDLTTAANCAGAEEASVAMAADILTITICAGDGGAILAGHSVGVKIGNNAVSSGIGSNRITNPSGEGTYYVSIGGSFGDSGSIAVAIGGDDTIGVNATVNQAGGGGGGGGGGPPPDVTPPVISNVTVSNVTQTSATVSWNTNEDANSNVDYGTTASYEIGTESNISLVQSHAINLTGFAAGTLYHFRVRSADANGNMATTGDFTFTTLDTTPPVVSSVQVVDITQTTARVVWNTDEPSTSVVNYGTTASYGTTQSDATLVTSHSVVLTDLSFGTLYHFRVRSTDAAGNEQVSGDGTFATQPNPPPGNVSNLTVTPGDSQNSLSWTNPTDDDLARIKVIRCLSTPNGPNEPGCVTVFNSLGTSVVDTGLSNGTTYHYGVFAVDTAGQFSTGALGEGTPSAPVEELPPPPPPPVPPPVPPTAPPPPPPPGGATETCGDRICSSGESRASCPADCGPVTPTAVCGNQVCEEGEDNALCAQDCPTNLLSEQTLRQDIEFFVTPAHVQLVASANQVVRSLAGRPLRAQLLALHFEKPVKRVELTIGTQSYLMAPNFSVPKNGNLRAASFGDDAFVADVTTPETPSTYPLTVNVLYEDNSAQTTTLLLDVGGDGYTYAVLEGAATRLGASHVTLLADEGSTVWDGSPYGEQNPVTTGADGSFAWYVPNGTYVVSAEKEGYLPAQTSVLTVTDNIINTRIQMASAVPPPAVPPLPLIPASVTNAINQGLETVRNIPGVEQAATISVPALAVTASLTAITLALGFNLLPFLQYLFTAPILFFARRRRRAFGIVYNGISKVPIDLATVRLFRLPGPTETGVPSTGRLVQSRVTDRGGRYFFLVDPGIYRLTVNKAGFDFPSSNLKDKTEDHEFLDLYHGEPIVVTESHAVIAANVPLDPSQAEAFHAPAKVIFQARLRSLQNVVAILGVVASLVFAVIQPGVFTFVMVGVQALVYLLVRRLAKPKKAKNWGIVYDESNKKPLGRVVARVFEPQYNKLLETTVTDAAGRYNFVLGPNQYYVVFEKEGYKPVEVRPVDYSAQNQPQEFGMKVSMPPTTQTT